MKKTPLARGTKQLKRSGFKNKPRKQLRNGKFKASGTLKRTRKKKTKRPTTPPLKSLRKRLWDYTRFAAFEKYGSDCFTCTAKNLVGWNRQGGHVPWPKSILPAKCAFDIRFIRAQCGTCNQFRGGMGAVAYERMKKENPAELAQMEIDRHILGKADTQFYLDEIAKYETPQMQTLPL